MGNKWKKTDQIYKDNKEDPDQYYRHSKWMCDTKRKVCCRYYEFFEGTGGWDPNARLKDYYDDCAEVKGKWSVHTFTPTARNMEMLASFFHGKGIKPVDPGPFAEDAQTATGIPPTDSLEVDDGADDEAPADVSETDPGSFEEEPVDEGQVEEEEEGGDDEEDEVEDEEDEEEEGGDDEEDEVEDEDEEDEDEEGGDDEEDEDEEGGDDEEEEEDEDMIDWMNLVDREFKKAFEGVDGLKRELEKLKIDNALKDATITGLRAENNLLRQYLEKA